jgi:hypothetical protein
MSQVLATARTYLNDDSAAFFPDPVLIPKVQEAHREMQAKLWIIGSPIVRGFWSGNSSASTVPVSIAQSGSGDFLFPFEVFEAPSPANTPLAPVTEIDFIPLDFVAQPNIIYFTFTGSLNTGIVPLVLSPHTATRYVTYNYRKLITVPVVATDLIGVMAGEQYLAPRAAALAADALGNSDLAGALTAQAEENFADVISVNRGQQKPTERP